MKALDFKRIKQLCHLEATPNISAWFFFNSLPSTQQFLKARIRQDNQSRLEICLTHMQTAGIGRRGNKWSSPRGNLYVSFRWPLKQTSQQALPIGIAIALSLAKALNAALESPRITVKWPNDLMANDQKVAGVLLELVPNRSLEKEMVVGLGLNLSLPPDSNNLATTLLALDPSADLEQLAAKSITHILQTLTYFEKYGFSYFQKEWPMLDYFQQSAVTVQREENAPDYGFIQSIDALGRLEFYSAITGLNHNLGVHAFQLRKQDLLYCQVGGSVRDELLKREHHDHDWVVLGQTPAGMQARGFIPVGKHFPVFLHPKTHEEYALARTERKAGQGHQAFHFFASPKVSLQADLLRRDLTINAMAKLPHGEIYDPFAGQIDLANRWLRHVSPAFQEDPLRVLRVARFAAQLAPYHFKVAPETKALMHKMVTSGECQHLSTERIWQETEKALCSDSPAFYFHTLSEIQADKALFQYVPTPADIERLTWISTHTPKLHFRYLLLLAHTDQPLLKAPVLPKQLLELQQLFYQYQTAFQTLLQASPSKILQLLRKTDALRRQARWQQLIQACQYYWQRPGSHIAFDANEYGQELIALQQTLVAYKLHIDPKSTLLPEQQVTQQYVKLVEKFLKN